KRRRFARCCEPHARLRPARERPAPELERREQLRRFRTADAGDSREIVAGRSRETVEAALRRQQTVRDRQCAATPPAAAQHERDELVVAESGRTMTQQLFARPIRRRQFLHLLYLLNGT